MAEEQWTREELLSRMQNGRAELEAVLAQVPAGEMTATVLANGWSVRDLLVHLAFWEQRAVALYGFVTGGPEPEPKPGEVSTDELNASVYAAGQSLSAADAVAREREAYQALYQLAASAPEADLFDPQRFAWTQGQPFGGWIAGNGFGHFEEHLPDLRGWLGLPGEIAFAVDGQPAHGYAAHAAKGGPGVIVLHAWWGLNGFFRQFCDRLAAYGFIVFAPDLNNGAVAATVAEAEKLMETRDFSRTNAIVKNAAAQLRRQPGIKAGALGVVGFSMGAAWATVLSTAQPDDIAAAVLFYGGEHVDFSKAKAAFMGHFAPGDEWEPDEGIRQLEAEIQEAGREVAFHRYPGAGHWFFEADRPDAYQAEAATLAWQRTLGFLKAKL